MEDIEKVEVSADVTATVEGTSLKPTGATLARTVAFALVWLNQLFAFMGAPTLDLDPEGVYAAVSTLVTFVVTSITYWKNNSFTPGALLADAVMKAFNSDEDQ